MRCSFVKGGDTACEAQGGLCQSAQWSYSLVGAHLHSRQLAEDNLVKLFGKLISDERLLALYQPLACLEVQLFHSVIPLQHQGAGDVVYFAACSAMHDGLWYA
jgi:hypothetical protein